MIMDHRAAEEVATYAVMKHSLEITVQDHPTSQAKQSAALLTESHLVVFKGNCFICHLFRYLILQDSSVGA